jgi:Spy/CpxP family protein refolding chaperone
MKNNLLKYLLVLSLLLNFSFLGAAGYAHYQRNRYPSTPFGYGPPGRVPAASPSIHPHLFEALSLSPEQRKIFEQKAVFFHEALDKKREEVDRLRTSLFSLMRAESPNSKAIEATISEINRAQEDMQKLVVAHMLQFKSMLNEDQQRKFFDLIQGAMATREEIQCP